MSSKIQRKGEQIYFKINCLFCLMCYHETLECFYFIAMAIQARKKRTKAKGKAKVDGGKKKK